MNGSQAHKQLIRIGTRHSDLATWQAQYVADRLRALDSTLEVRLVYVTTHGDRELSKALPEIGGKGIFTRELEDGLASGEIDLAVHSLKDLPTDGSTEFVIAAVPERETVFDALISRTGKKLSELLSGAAIGTGSLRRSAQLKAIRPDLNVIPLRGNVPTRLRKALDSDSPFDAIVLALAGLNRLGLTAPITETLPLDVMLPAPGQGALGIQCRASDRILCKRLVALEHSPTRLAVEAERSFLTMLGSNCRLPIAAYAQIEPSPEGERLTLTGRVLGLEGKPMIAVEQHTALSPSDVDRLNDAHAIGEAAARQALANGAGSLLAALSKVMEKSAE